MHQWLTLPSGLLLLEENAGTHEQALGLAWQQMECEGHL